MNGGWRRSTLVIGLLAGLAGWAIGVRQQHFSVATYAALRVPVINAHLADAPAGFVLLAGDSHAEWTSSAIHLCGTEIVNAGIGGARAALYADRVLPLLSFPKRARAALLLIGTNDIRKSAHPRDAAQVERFDQGATRLVRGLQAHADRVIVTALPPLGHDVRSRDAGAAALYSAHLAAMCQSVGCNFTDPFAALREGSDGFAIPGASADGVHLLHYRAVLSSLEAELCPPPA